jgi:L-serine deaminase
MRINSPTVGGGAALGNYLLTSIGGGTVATASAIPTINISNNTLGFTNATNYTVDNGVQFRITSSTGLTLDAEL